MKQIFTVEVKVKKPTNRKLSILQSVFRQYSIIKAFVLKLLRDNYQWFIEQYEMVNVKKNGELYELKYKHGSVVFRISHVQKFCKQFTIPARMMYSAIDSALEVFSSFKAIENEWENKKASLEERIQEARKEERKKDISKLTNKLNKHIRSKPTFPKLPQWFEGMQVDKALGQTNIAEIDFAKWQETLTYKPRSIHHPIDVSGSAGYGLDLVEMNNGRIALAVTYAGKLAKDQQSHRPSSCRFKSGDRRIYNGNFANPKSPATGLQHIILPIEYGTYQRAYFDEVKRGITRIGTLQLLERNGDFYLQMSLERQTDNKEPCHFLGVDVGQNNAIALSIVNLKGEIAFREYCKAFVTKEDKQRYRKIAAALQMRGKVPPKLKDQEEHFLHEQSKRVVNMAKAYNATIILEKIDGLKFERTWEHVPYKTKYRKQKRNMNYLLNTAPLRKLQFMIEYKSKLAGLEVCYIKPAYTSRVCSNCLKLEDYLFLPIHSVYTKRLGEDFSCQQCGSKYINADENAAINIARKGLADQRFYLKGKIVDKVLRNKVETEKKLWERVKDELKKLKGSENEKNYVFAYESVIS